MRRVLEIAMMALAVGCLGCGDDGGGEKRADAGGFVGDGSCTAPMESTFAITGAGHVTGEIDYQDRPPAGGNHHQCWGRWGVHESELADERWVHNLEHGGVVYLYRCDGDCPDEVAALSAFVTGRKQALLTPYAELPTRFAVVAWGYRMVSDCLDQRAFEAFYDAHVGNGPEGMVDQEPSGVCAQ